jgi:hypothetical protein
MSPISTDRAFQQLLLVALKETLKRCNHLIKEGDLLTVPIPSDSVRLLSSQASVAEDTPLPSFYELEQYVQLDI